VSIVDQILACPEFDDSCVVYWRGWLALEAMAKDESAQLKDAALAAWDRICAHVGATRADIHEARRERLSRLRSMPYAVYLHTPHWRMVRKEALVAGLHCCRICASPDHLNVHHRTYERRGWELLLDLTVLCAECHQLFHEHRRLAT
jgi:hypothetical protein